MKFISKQSNYRVVLKQGQPAEPISGRNFVPGMYIKFENGVVNIEDEATCELMMKHAGFNSDYILSEEDQADPFEDSRKNIEPDHHITKIEYGHVGKSDGAKISPFTKEQQIVMKNMAKEMAAEMAPKLAMELITKMSKDNEDKQPSKELEEKKTDTIEPVTEEEDESSDSEKVIDEKVEVKKESNTKKKTTDKK